MDRGFKQVVGWAMRGKADTDMVLQALLAAAWRRKPKPNLLVHSDQFPIYISDDWSKFLEAHGLMFSMSRRGNCLDDAPVERFLGLLKRERTRACGLTSELACAAKQRRLQSIVKCEVVTLANDCFLEPADRYAEQSDDADVINCFSV